mgnify:CR=1 FL=1
MNSFKPVLRSSRTESSIHAMGTRAMKKGRLGGKSHGAFESLLAGRPSLRYNVANWQGQASAAVLHEYSCARLVRILHTHLGVPFTDNAGTPIGVNESDDVDYMCAGNRRGCVSNDRGLLERYTASTHLAGLEDELDVLYLDSG